MTKEFSVIKMQNGYGHNHLLVITEPAVEDVHIGSVAIIPYAEGFIDPISVKLLVDKNGLPQLANKKFAIVLEYIYEN